MRWRALVGLGFALAAADCGTSPRQNCTELGYACGIDDFGNSCGACAAGRTCAHGACYPGTTNPGCGCGAAACGYDACGTLCGVCADNEECTAGYCLPTTSAHPIGSGSLPLFSSYGYYRFFLPADADVRFTTGTTDNDTYDVGVFTPENYVTYSSGQRASGWAIHPGVHAVTDHVSLVAGTYYLGFYCTNTFERCAVTYTVTATY